MRTAGEFMVVDAYSSGLELSVGLARPFHGDYWVGIAMEEAEGGWRTLQSL